MTGVEGLKEIEYFASAAFPQDDSIWAHSQDNSRAVSLPPPRPVLLKTCSLTLPFGLPAASI